MTFPNMAETFTMMTRARDGYPPLQRDFTLAVVHGLGLKQTPAIAGRIGRAWASFAVQWHAHVALNELLPLAIWDPKADTEFGVDVIAFDDADPLRWIAVGLAIRVPGAAGAYYAGRKGGRHRSPGFVTREVLCDRREHPVGPFWPIAPERLQQVVRDAAADERRRQEAEADEALYEYALKEGDAAGYDRAVEDFRAGRLRAVVAP